ncbi:PREDICTED: epidermal growth factor receptor substrate 15-like [Cyprinodon variegatus]|uniref:epidermal growth factor receptor substrate 15-like n=1 Tax=Cyprinodon variegatus TaxID=28743 RepID=UPI0007426EBB|nr:PREDICTED: epidermal growth factor receptor substrate 15-like [Cyprinodon variegatus]
MEEPAVQQEKIEKSQEPGEDAGKAGWKNECSFSNLLKHSCFICWSSPGDTEVIEMDERVLAKAAEIRELENALAVENLELQEQQSDCKDLEETLVKFEEHKEKLIQQIKATRQLCYEESQKILSLQAEEAQKESQVEEYERELARARWRLKKLREEVKKAKRKVEEAGERDTPLQDSIRQSYEEILQVRRRSFWK